MRPLLTIPLTIVLFGCQEVPSFDPCQPTNPEIYRYEDRSSSERLSVTRERQRLLFDFHIPETDYRSSKVYAQIVDAGDHIQITNLLIPKDLSDETISNATTDCNVRSGGPTENLYRVDCKPSHEKASEVVLLDTEKGIVEWSTLDEDGSKISDYILQSDSGLLHPCLN